MDSFRSLAFLLSTAFILAPLSRAQSTYPYAVQTLAGSGFLGDGGPAVSALLEFPQSVVADSAGNVYIGDNGNGRIRVVNATGTIKTFTFGVAASMKMDSTGAIYASDGVALVYKILPDGNAAILAGTTTGYSGDNGPATSARLNGPNGVAVDAVGDVFVADTYNCLVREITPDGKIQTIAGNGTAAFGREQIAATSSPLAYPYGVEVDASGNVYISEEYRIRKVTNGIINTIAGDGVSPVDGAAIDTALGLLVALAEDKSSNLYLADASYNMVRMISPAGIVTTLAGSQTAGFAGDGSYGFKALLNGPSGVSVDPRGNVYIADELNQRIRRLTAAGIVSTVAGATHYTGDGGPATAALLHRPEQAVTDSVGNL